MEELGGKELRVTHESDVVVARRTAREMAGAVGFGENPSAEIGLAVSELAANLVRHAGGGVLYLKPLQEEERSGMEIESVDAGPGIADVERAMMDGFTTGGGLGYGLGAVNRAMDEFDIGGNERGGRGTRVTGRRWVLRREPESPDCPLEFGTATRPHPRMRVNGDAFCIERWERSALVAVIDGLGHGQFAHRAAQAARQYVAGHFDQPLANIFRGVGHSCRATRGVVMALARFDWGEGQMSFAGIGNIEVRVFGGAELLKFVTRRGVIGGKAPNPVVSEHRWEPSRSMVLHSDGIRSQWSWKEFAHLEDGSAATIARMMLRGLAREEDDATVVVVRGAR